MKPAADAIVIDTTGMSIDAVVDRLAGRHRTSIGDRSDLGADRAGSAVSEPISA